MSKSNLKLTLLSALFTVFFCLSFFTGCASLNFKAMHNIKVYDLAKQISNTNKEIKTSKGLGWLKITENHTEIVFKIAWITEPPDKIRATLISGGLPVETIASNGEKIAFFSHTGKHKLKTYNIKNPSLEDIILIPVRIRDIIALLSGQIPIKDFKYAFIDNQINQIDNSLETIILKNSADKGIQKLYLDSEKQVKKYMLTDWKADPLYNIVFLDSIKIDSLTIPSKILIQDNLNRKVTLEISKFHKNLSLKKSLFTLTDKR